MRPASTVAHLAGRAMCQVSAPSTVVASAASPPFLLRVLQLLVGLVEQDKREDGDSTSHVQVGLGLHAEAARALQNGQAAADDEVLHPTDQRCEQHAHYERVRAEQRHVGHGHRHDAAQRRVALGHAPQLLERLVEGLGPRLLAVGRRLARARLEVLARREQHLRGAVEVRAELRVADRGGRGRRPVHGARDCQLQRDQLYAVDARLPRLLHEGLLRQHHRQRHQGEELPREAGEGLAALQPLILGVDALRLLLLLLLVVV
mmetsp:Transcript_28840/g.68013  ORF Transcript_28840/g.68013 Transcript_28840/m.68013 type:complete len:261 (+) Transcript_28840:80-862(+)